MWFTEQVEALRNRALKGRYRYLWLDATTFPGRRTCSLLVL
jgi:transposase-like protein